MRKKTIAYINPDCFADTDLSVLKYLAPEFDLHWYAVYYTDRDINYKPDALAAYAEANGIDIHLCPRKYRQRDPRNLFFYHKIVSDINRHHPDLVYTCISEELWWTLSLYRINSPVKVLGIHDVVRHSYSGRIKPFIQTRIQDFTIKHFEHFFVFSENQRMLFSQKYGKDAACPGMSRKNFGPAAKSAGPLGKGVKLLFFGSIERYKGLDLLIKELESLAAEGVNNIRLTIAGRGNDWDACASLINTESLYNLQIGFIDNADIPNLFGAHHFLILPYRDATQSGPQLIALNYGLPIIAPAYGCFKEVYGEDSALLYDSLAAALRRVANMPQDEYDAICTSVERDRERFSEEAIAEAYIKNFSILMNNNENPALQ